MTAEHLGLMLFTAVTAQFHLDAALNGVVANLISQIVTCLVFAPVDGGSYSNYCVHDGTQCWTAARFKARPGFIENATVAALKAKFRLPRCDGSSQN